MKKMKSWILAGLIFFVGWAAASCGGSAKNKEADAIKIGVFEPLTGDSASGGLEELAGIELAHQEKSMVLGRPVELVKADSQSNALTAGQVAEKLVKQDKVTAALGSFGSYLAVAGGPKFLAGKVPIIAPGASSPAVTLDNPYYFRVCSIDPDQGEAMADFAANDLHAKTAMIFKNMGSNYSISQCNAFAENFKKFNGPESIMGEHTYITGEMEFSKEAELILKHDPDVIFAGGEYKECLALILTAREKGYNKPILGGDTWDTADFIAGLGNSADIYLTAYYHPDNTDAPGSQAFVEKCKKQNIPLVSCTALGYDAYMVLLNAIERAGSTDSEAIRKAIAETKDFPGVSGLITLNETGDPIKPVVIDTIKDGKVDFVTSITP